MTKLVAKPCDFIRYITDDGKEGGGTVLEEGYEDEGFFVVKVTEGSASYQTSKEFDFEHTYIWCAIGDRYTIMENEC